MGLWLLGPVMCIAFAALYIPYKIVEAICRAIYNGIKNWVEASDLREWEREQKRKAKEAEKLSGKTPRETP